MNAEMKKEKISMPSCVFEVSSEEKIELDVNLPDYCSDIKRVLRCFVTPGINSTQIAGDRLSVKGEVIIRLMYVGEDGKIDCCEQTVALSKHTDVKNMPENPVLICNVKPLYINSRAASQRRFTVSGNLLVTFKVFTVLEKEVAKAVSDDDIEIKCEQIEVVTKSVIGEKTFDMSETVSLDEGQKAVGRVLHTEAKGEISSVKAVNGKILLKGDMKCRVLYVADTKDKSLEVITHSMPINQIIEVAGLESDYKTDISLDTANILVGVKADSSGANKLLEIALKVCAFVVGTKNSEALYIKDAYNKKYESKFLFDDSEFMSFIGSLDKKKSVNATFDLSSQNPKEILDVRVISQDYSLFVNGKDAEIKVNHTFALIFADEKGKIQYAERNGDVSFSYENKNSCEKLYCTPEISAEDISCNLQGDKANVKYDVKLSGNLFKLQNVRMLQSADCDETKLKPKGDEAITVYYCSKGEKIWDIAKRYNTSEKAIKEENSLDTETVKADMMLII